MFFENIALVNQVKVICIEIMIQKTGELQGRNQRKRGVRAWSLAASPNEMTQCIGYWTPVSPLRKIAPFSLQPLIFEKFS